MKRFFVILSNLLTSLFLVWMFTIWSDTYVSHYYPSVSVYTSKPEASFEKLADSLSHLAKETDSLIAIQHQEPGAEGKTVFTYTVFGQGKLPEPLSEKKTQRCY
ncbi:immunity protein, bacteriocin-associated integral membrane protein subfamily [Streptococcus dysgalactiae subsp. dysgalactiae]|uniref:Immunity protein, bacteriocin-associated integral membrane protein subfamily n=1 Tax=Streptococcus dysgalactiae subsp. dysgalactiae TaxID=99822 RepID=A0A380JZC5_STRDY|nr:immunity protein, bacteriocin-associated integral membrane protein subfamily [Streptococcus dysgalactiae subsp. dysgalactiae]